MQRELQSTSRRRCLKAALTGLAAATLPAFATGDTKAAGKIAKTTVHYQDHPKSGKMCGMCRFFIAPGATSPGRGMMGSGNMMGSGDMMRDGSCQLVAGSVSPMGYCELYQPRRK